MYKTQQRQHKWPEVAAKIEEWNLMILLIHNIHIHNANSTHTYAEREGESEKKEKERKERSHGTPL